MSLNEQNLSNISGGLTDGLNEQQRAVLKEMYESGADPEKIQKKRIEYLKSNNITDYNWNSQMKPYTSVVIK